jgi:hypothetical protein
MFATIVIILPSKFTGGSLQLSHAGQKVIVDTSTFKAEYFTHVVGWYTDVYHAVTPVESGYRLALSYNLVHTAASSARPVISSISTEWKQLKDLFRRWSKSDDPHRIVYLLDHMYSENNLLTHSLKGKDAHRVSHLRSIGESLGFRFCLLNLELYKMGLGGDDYRPSYRRTPEIADLVDSTLSVVNAFDMNGQRMELSERLGLDDDEIIPKPLGNTTPTDTEDEGYQGNVSTQAFPRDSTLFLCRRPARCSFVRFSASLCILANILARVS